MGKLILRNVSLNPIVEAYVKDKYEIISVADLNEQNSKDIEVLLTNGTGVAQKDLLDRLPNLKLIDDFGVGYDGVDVAECKKRNIALCNTPDVLTDDVADMAMLLMLNLSRQFAKAHNYVQSLDWEAKKSLPLANKLSGKKVGIFGLGRIGMAIAKRCCAFDMQIFYHSRSDKHISNYTYCNSLNELAQHVDFLIVCAAANAQNKGIIDKSILQALGSKGSLINIARGSLVDEDALCYAIENNIIKGAGLDVFVDEPHVPKSLLGRDNVVLTPHIGSATEETRAQMAAIVIENLKAFEDGKPYITKVDL